MLIERSDIVVGRVWGTSALKRRLAEHCAPYALPRQPWLYRGAKRALDICGASLGLILLALLFPWIALCILYEDRGPLFYRQVRVGQHGRPFYIYKFRSMVVNADRYLEQHPALLARWRQCGKLVRDPRVTRIGAFLRRSSLDELPQMLNVLRGEMSLVGPRAVQYSELAAFGELGHLCLAVRPGLSGLWQVCGRSSTANYLQRCILDSTYVLNCSFSMDVHILCKTLPVVIRGYGAF
ncbi:MAG: sugar transferase [Ktedonobacteraceae bacterium]|nr:sugar transferase [Ktedonobacteraceae bacterium]